MFNVFYPYDENESYIGYDWVVKTNKVDFEADLNRVLNARRAGFTLIETDSTSGISREMIELIPEDVSLRIKGGYTLTFLAGIKNSNHLMLWEKATYTRKELLKIYDIFEDIESKLGKRWDAYDKALFIYEYIKKNIHYHKINRIDRMHVSGMASHGREKETLMSLLSGVATSYGLAFIYQEMLNRIGISCTQIGGLKGRERTAYHSWNVVKVDSDSFAVDLSIDVQKFEEGKNEISGFGLFDVDGYIPKNNRDVFEKIDILDEEIIRKKQRKVNRKKRAKSLKKKVRGGKKNGR